MADESDTAIPVAWGFRQRNRPAFGIEDDAVEREDRSNEGASGHDQLMPVGAVRACLAITPFRGEETPWPPGHQLIVTLGIYGSWPGGSAAAAGLTHIALQQHSSS